MINLRHIKGRDLRILERQLEKTNLPLVVQSISFVNGEWYIHFFIQGVADKKEVVIEEALETKTLNKGK